MNSSRDDFEQAARLWQQYWDRLSDRPRYFGLDMEHSKSCVPGIGNLGCLAEQDEHDRH